MGLDICKFCDIWIDTDDGAEYVPVHKYKDVCLCPECFMALQYEAKCDYIVQVV